MFDSRVSLLFPTFLTPTYLTVNDAVALWESVPAAGETAVYVAVNVSVYLPLLAFFAVTEATAVDPFTTTEFGKAQVVFEATGKTLQASDMV